MHLLEHQDVVELDVEVAEAFTVDPLQGRAHLRDKHKSTKHFKNQHDRLLGCTGWASHIFGSLVTGL